MTPPLIILTGASGAGKTTLARHLTEVSSDPVRVLFFDSIGVPSLKDMIADFGSGEAWQRIHTLHWMARIRTLLSGQIPVLFEGQMRIQFIEEALAAQHIESARIVLVDCDDATRRTRLHRDRGQPHLANAEMMNWARYLRAEAMARHLEILDTGQQSVEECLSRIRTLLFPRPRGEEPSTT